MSRSEIEIQSAKLILALQNLEEFRQARTIALYAPMSTEVQLGRLFTPYLSKRERYSNDGIVHASNDTVSDTSSDDIHDEGEEQEQEQQPQKTFYFPRVHADNHLHFSPLHSFHDFSHWPLNPKYKFREPPFNSPTVHPTEIDLVIVPGVAFDTAGRRLGQGKGYYDRFLNERAKRRMGGVVALGFGCQLVDEVPVDRWDVLVDKVLVVGREGVKNVVKN